MGVINVIKYEGDNRTFIAKHPSEDFNTSSQLIVHESQRAIFFYNGQALDMFGPGRYTLETQNIPLLTSASSRLLAGGDTPFHAEIYFANLVEQMGIEWGTNARVQYMDPEFNFPLSIGASGEMALAVTDPRKLLLKLVGTEAILSQERLIGYFKSFLQVRIKATLANAISESKLCVFQLDQELESISESVKTKLQPDFENYGMGLTQFFITNIVRPETDPLYAKFRELYFRRYADVREAEIAQMTAVIDAETLAKKEVIGSQARAKMRELEGYTYQQERSFDVAEKVAENEAAGEFSNAGLGIGMFAGASVPLGNMVSTSIGAALGAPAQNAPGDPTDRAAFCSRCGFKFDSTSMNFCPACGTKRG